MAPRSRTDYTVGWISALPIELAAAQEMLDEQHEDLPQPSGDSNIYTLGRIGEHSVVIVCPPAGQTGIGAAAAAAMQMKSSFTSIRFGLMVGVGGGVPSGEEDIRLGDVVVSQPANGHGGVIQYDFGKTRPDLLERTGFLNAPPLFLLAAVAKLRAHHDRGCGSLEAYVSKIAKIPKFSRERAGRDVLYDGDCTHGKGAECEVCKVKEIKRDKREDGEIAMHFGTVASGNQVMRSGKDRDKISREFGEVLCFEMEAAGLMMNFPCLVVRGICDYADSHKTKRWQPYAAGTAAAYAKDLLMVIPPKEIIDEQTVQEATRSLRHTTNSVTFGSGNYGNQIGVAYGPVQLAPEHVEAPPEPDCFNVPALEPTFVHRRALCDELNMRASIPDSRSALIGLGGIGKTQLAIKFVKDKRKQDPNLWVLWIHARNALRFEESVGDISNHLRLFGRRDPKANLLQLLQYWLADTQGGTKRWIIVLDNVDNADFLLRPPSNAESAYSTKRRIDYFPFTEGCSVLITSRTKDEAGKLVHKLNMIEVPPMGHGDADELLRKGLGSQYDKPVGSHLAETLDFIPLALSQAISYLQQLEHRCTISEYIRMLESSRAARTDLLRRGGSVSDGDRDASDSIILTWQISFAHINKTRPTAAKLLALMSFCDHQAIPECLLNVRDTSETAVDENFEDDVLALRAFSFVSYAHPESESWQMHRLVQDSMHWWLRDRGEYVQSEAHYITRLDLVLPTGEYENWEKCKLFLPHTENAVNITTNDQEVALRQAEVMYKVAWYTLLQGNTNLALARAWASLTLRRSHLAENHESTLASMEMLALVKLSAGRWKEAEELEVKVMETRRTVLGAEHPSTLMSMANLALTYKNQGRWKEAEELQVKVMETRKTVLGAEHLDTLMSMGNLATTYMNQGRWKEAEELQVKVMETSRTVLGAEHPSTLTIMANLASTYKNQGRWKEAEELQVKVMETSRTVLGAEHPSTLTIMANLASTYMNQGRWREAEELQIKVMETWKTVLGAEHLDTLTIIGNLALTYMNQGRWREAEELKVKVMKTRRTILGAEHPDTLMSMGNLASTYRYQGRWREAEELQVKVMETSRTVLGAEHPDTLTSMANLAVTYYGQRRFQEAQDLMTLCVEARLRVLGAVHPDTKGSLSFLEDWSSLDSRGRV